MTGPERGFALLCCQLGDPERRPLTVAQFRTLTKRVAEHRPDSRVGELDAADLMALGFDGDFSQRVVDLLSAQAQLDWYLENAARNGCTLITRGSPGYPLVLRKRLGLDSPGCLWAKGDLSLLEQPGVSLVGSRELNPLNQAFAWEVGYQAAKQGYVLISGNARGADRTAQEAALENGGCVISIVADCLSEQTTQKNMLYLSENGFDLPFSGIRALSRNRLIHAMGAATFVAQCRLGKGGTWDGTVKNLKAGWSPVFCLDDGSEASVHLAQMGAQLISGAELCDFGALQSALPSLFD